MSQDVKLHIFQQIHTPSGNRLTGSYFCSVTGYDKQTSFTALLRSSSSVKIKVNSQLEIFSIVNGQATISL